MAKWGLRDKIQELLEANPGKRFTGRDIANWIFENHRNLCEEKRSRMEASGKSVNDKELVQQIVREAVVTYRGVQRRSPKFKFDDVRPRRFYFSEADDETEIKESEEEGIISTAENNEKIKLTEHDLYPLLLTYLSVEFLLYGKRIDEKRSRNTRGRGGNHWLYPDVVAMEDLSADWESEVKELVAQSGSPKAKLWSFEVKIRINASNVRECFFQAVSNSSWANLGYLVASEISGDALDELRILASLHSIGFILLDAEEPADSQIIIPARERPEVDWDIINRITGANEDFIDYVNWVVNFYKLGDVRHQDWDDAPENYGDED